MAFTNFLLRPSTTICLLMLAFAVQASASASTTLTAPQSIKPALLRRTETVGSSCDTEGEWNCMTDSFQRCASGRWSAEMQCAAGTICTPSGLTEVFRIEYSDSSDNGQAPSGSGSSSALKGGVSRGLAEVVVGLWALALGGVIW